MHKNRFSIFLLALALTAVSAGCTAAPEQAEPSPFQGDAAVSEILVPQPWTEAEIPVDGKIWNLSLAGDCIFMELMLEREDKNAQKSDKMELGIYNTATDSYQKLADTPALLSYGTANFTMGQYLGMIRAWEDYEAGGFQGMLAVYDTKAQEFRMLDQYAAGNIVQYAAPLNDTTIAYLFYEADLQAWSVRLYDLTTAESRHIYTHTNKETRSPAGMTCVDGKIVIALQATDGSMELLWLTGEGSAEKTETIPFEANAQITALRIMGDYYCISTARDVTVLRRKGDTFAPVKIPNFYLDYLKSDCMEEALIFGITGSTEADSTFVGLDFAAESVNVYRLPAAETEEQRMYTEFGSDGTILLLTQEDVPVHDTLKFRYTTLGK